MAQDNDNVVHDITDAAPTMEPKTRRLVKKVATITALAGGAVLAADAGLRRFKERKTVKVVVADKPESETTES